MAGLTRYLNVWKNLFGIEFINLGIREDRVVNVLWRVRDIAFPPRLKMLSYCLVRITLTKFPPMILFKD